MRRLIAALLLTAMIFSAAGAPAEDLPDVEFVEEELPDEDNPEGKISQVSTNGMTMNMKGYRAYFKLPGTSAGKSLAVRFDDNGTNAIITAVAEQKPVDVFNLAGGVFAECLRNLLIGSQADFLPA